jgi:diguanylate cyclase
MSDMYEPHQRGFSESQHSGFWLQPTQHDTVVLMIDDEPMMTDVAQTYLEDAGYRQFVAVHDPMLALDAARRCRPGLILLDLRMPGMDGFDLLKAFRRDEALRYTPVIVLTAASDPTSKLRALELGATEFLSKPVDESELKIRVRNSLAFKVYQDRLANDDPLTGLPNRRVFVEYLGSALAQANAYRRRVALLNVNLDRFRLVNDTLGPSAGDALLASVAERLRLIARAEVGARGNRAVDAPTLARTGGDEFALLLPDAMTADGAARVARQVLTVLAKPFVVNGSDLIITPSIGIAMFPDDGGDEATLLRNAGVANQHAKDNGRNNFQFYSPDLNHVSLERLLLETQLRRAIERHELVLHYQPKVELATGCVYGAEALLRWQHPELGLISPGRFIPIAEETGQIVEIGSWVIETACAQLARWRDEDGVAVRVAVNVARHSLVTGSFEDVVRSAIQRHRVQPGQLVLELTESMLMDRVEATAARLQALRALGVDLSIDDFGTGYSSMSYLKQFPVQELKIDRSFVSGTPQDRTDHAIVRALVVLGHSLGMKVVAEGVETEAQRDALAALDCDSYQGFLCSPALPPDEFITRMRENNGS